MRGLLAAFRRVAGMFTRSRAEREFDAELNSHLQLHIDEHLRAGRTPAEARRLALARLGGRQQVREMHRDRHGLPVLDQLYQDARFALRLFIRNPGFSLLTIATLTIGLGMNILVFSIGYPIVTTPLPGADSDRLVRIFENEDSNVAFANYIEYRDRNRTLSGLTATRVEGSSLRTVGGVVYAKSLVVTGDYFGVLGVGAALGRTLTPADDRPESPAVAVLSHGTWTRQFGNDQAVVGRTLSINGRPFTVIGVALERFPGTVLPAVPELYLTWHGAELMPSLSDLARGEGRSVQLIGRLRPETGLSQAQADLSAIVSDLSARFPGRGTRTVNVYEGHMVPPSLRAQATAFLAVLLGLTVLVLGATAVNLAALQLARSTARRTEMDVRSALGAGRGRLIRQLLTENLLLSAIACGCSFAFVFGGARLLALWSATTPSGVTLTVQPVVAWQVVTFALALSLGTTVLIGLVPALRAAHWTASSLGSVRTATGARIRRRPILIATQTAGSTLLIVLAGVLIRSLGEAQAIDRGFSTDRVLSGSLDLAGQRGGQPERAAFYAGVQEAAARTPGVASAALVEIVPLTMSNRERGLVAEGQAAPTGSDFTRALVSTNNISPGYFEVVGIPLVAGRDFSSRDGHDAPAVAIVNETLARRYWPNDNPVGRRVRSWSQQQGFGDWIEVIGVARDSKYTTVGESPRAFYYRPLAQVPAGGLNVLIKTVSSDPLTALPTLRSSLERFDETVPLFAVDTLESQTRLSTLPIQVAAILAAVLGLVALTLTAIGIYGVTAQVVRQRTREAAIRVALGAEPERVVRALVRSGLTWAVVGLVIGLAGAAASTRLLASLLYGVGAIDPVAFLSVTALVSAMAYLACWWPSRQIVRTDPATTLRAE